MPTPDFTYGFFGRLRAAAAEEWAAYVRHPFVSQLGAGTLPEPCFKRFLVQDYLFLVQFARAYALAVAKCGTFADLRAATASLQVIVAEVPLHVGYCAQWGISEDDMAAEPEAPETICYTRYVLDIAHTGDALDLACATIPCVAGYAEIGKRLLSDPATVIDGNPYGPWISAYSSEAYDASVTAAILKLDDLWVKRGSEARFDQLLSIFAMATRLEAQFWQMGLNALAPSK